MNLSTLPLPQLLVELCFIYQHQANIPLPTNQCKLLID